MMFTVKLSGGRYLGDATNLADATSLAMVKMRQDKTFRKANISDGKKIVRTVCQLGKSFRIY